MSAMSLEAEKNELIRRILDVDDVAILRRVKSMLKSKRMLSQRKQLPTRQRRRFWQA